MTSVMELAPLELTPQAEQQPQTAEELEARVLELAGELIDPESWLHQNFYGALGVTPTEMTRVNRPAAGHHIYVKNETEHHMVVDGQAYNAATFKRRGALLAALVAVRDNPSLENFVTASAGNHALGVAFAAQALGKQAHIYCRSDISPAKEQKLLELGAILHKNDPVDPDGDTLETAMRYAKTASEIEDDNVKINHFIHPFDQVEVIAGQYTVGLEIVADLKAKQDAGLIDSQDSIEIDTAIGGGGHGAGIAIAVKEGKDQGKLSRNVKVRGARVEGGRLNTWCDGTATEPGQLPMLILCDKRYVEGVDLVTDKELADAMFELTGIFNKMAEPAGSLSYALAKKRAATQRMDTLRAEHAARAVERAKANLPEEPPAKPITYITTFTGANTGRRTYEYYMSIRDAAYHKNLRALGDLSTANEKSFAKPDPVTARKIGSGALLSGRVLR
jgi:threonine dehydratase